MNTKNKTDVALAATATDANFADFTALVRAQFARMSSYTMLRTEADKNKMWEIYIQSFPPGSNPHFKERTSHDCNSCKSFVHAIGNAVAVIDGNLETVWDIQIGGAYQVVADAMSDYVRLQAIADSFLHIKSTAGVERSLQSLEGGDVKEWRHFYAEVPTGLYASEDNVPTMLSKSRTTKEVFLRGLQEITLQGIDTALELIAQGSVYRGEEFQFAIKAFKTLKTEFNELKTNEQKELYAWTKRNDEEGKLIPEEIVLRIRNRAVGTFLIDLSEDKKDIQEAVDAFGRLMAPTNYKRTNMAITPSMIAGAKARLQAIGLESEDLERRYAVVSDVSVNNVLFADRSSRVKMSDNIFDQITPEIPYKPVRNMDRMEEMTMENFIRDILPSTESIELLFENRLVPKLFSLIAPVKEGPGRLFKWDNDFSWAYNGDAADAIKERVKKAGGMVEGDVCCRLAWNNTDDLDFHMLEPDGYEIFYGTKGRPSLSGGMLDVDMNAWSITTDPVENIFYKDKSRMKEGSYMLFVRQFKQRSTENFGFEVQIDIGGDVRSFSHKKIMKNGQDVAVATITYSKKEGIKITSALKEESISKKEWGITTQSFQKVNMMMLSPNHWDGAGVGNRHYFFVLDECTNPGNARGFLNEFLRSELEPHRKTFDVVGSKMRADFSPNQLSGVGFSTTDRSHVILRVKGAFTRDLKVTI